jgi:SAM-dependent methyltransferase
VENIEFVESGANALDFPAGTFDAAVSRWGIIFEPDGEGAAARVRGFLKPGSRFAIASWGPPDKVPFLGIPASTTMRRLGIEPPPPGTPGPLSRPTPEAIGGLLEGGGFTDVQVEEIEATFTWDSAEDFTVFVGEIAPPISAMINPQPPEVQVESWAAITEAIRERASEDGTVTLSNLVLLAVGSA